jgi:hypothetical protein
VLRDLLQKRNHSILAHVVGAHQCESSGAFCSTWTPWWTCRRRGSARSIRR